MFLCTRALSDSIIRPSIVWFDYQLSDDKLIAEWNTSYIPNHTTLTKFLMQPSSGDSLFKKVSILTSEEDTYFKFDHRLNYGTVHEIIFLPFAISEDNEMTFGKPLTSEIIVGYGKTLQFGNISRTRSSVIFKLILDGSCDYVVFQITTDGSAEKINCPEAIQDFITINRLLPATPYNVSAQVNLKTLHQTVHKIMLTEFGDVTNIEQKMLESGVVEVLVEFSEPVDTAKFCLKSNNDSDCFYSFPLTESRKLFNMTFNQIYFGRTIDVLAMIESVSSKSTEVQLIDGEIEITEIEMKTIDGEDYEKRFKLKFSHPVTRITLEANYNCRISKFSWCGFESATKEGECTFDLVIPGASVEVIITPFLGDVEGNPWNRTYEFATQVDTFLYEDYNLYFDVGSLTVYLYFVGHVSQFYLTLEGRVGEDVLIDVRGTIRQFC